MGDEVSCPVQAIDLGGVVWGVGFHGRLVDTFVRLFGGVLGAANVLGSEIGFHSCLGLIHWVDDKCCDAPFLTNIWFASTVHGIGAGGADFLLSAVVKLLGSQLPIFRFTAMLL
ncbi:hypothetical protein Nepgr_033983 [Nepenthes gracilis]|uniref:Uncharacterized protein n=1 Tax=Nepenthes gracilis TaxID=150966 RepID=A0AAD3TMR3_NEPGR|nr:hypothetical protein Nepgr_033983 [Nepenthes gracilis]